MAILEPPLTLTADPPPIRIDDGGAVRVGKTRVTLYTVLTAYKEGESAEQIAAAYPTLDLADIHTTIAYYLRHRTELDAFLAQQEQEAAEGRRQMETMFPPQGIRERLLARRKSPH